MGWSPVPPNLIGMVQEMKKMFVIGFVCGLITIFLTVSASVLTFFCPMFNPSLTNKLMFLPINEFDERDPGLLCCGVKAQEVFFPSKDPKVKLNGRLYIKEGAPQVVLYSHGQGGNVALVHLKIEGLLNSGASVFAYDYRGYGKSTGQPSNAGVIDDAHAAYEYILAHTQYKPEQIILYGESLGTGITSAIARNVKCAGVVLECGFISPEVIGKERFPIMDLYPSWMFPKPDLSNVPLVEGAHPPLLLITGKKDVVVPCHHTQYLYDHASEPKKLIVLENSAHSYFGPDQTKYETSLAKFYKECADARSDKGVLTQASSPAKI